MHATVRLEFHILRIRATANRYGLIWLWLAVDDTYKIDNNSDSNSKVIAWSLNKYYTKPIPQTVLFKNKVSLQNEEF